MASFKNKLGVGIASVAVAFSAIGGRVLADDAPGSATLMGRTAITAPRLQGEADIYSEIQQRYPAVERTGVVNGQPYSFKYIRMDRVPPGGDPFRDIFLLELSYVDARRSDNPITIVNYSADGFSHQKSEQQRAFLERAVPLLSQISTSEVILIDATALKKNPKGDYENVFLQNMLADQDHNKLGKDGTPVNFADGEFALPYARASVNGEMRYDFSWHGFSDSVPQEQIQRHVLLKLGSVVESSNQLVAGNSAPSAPALAAK